MQQSIEASGFVVLQPDEGLLGIPNDRKLP